MPSVHPVTTEIYITIFFDYRGSKCELQSNYNSCNLHLNSKNMSFRVFQCKVILFPTISIFINILTIYYPINNPCQLLNCKDFLIIKYMVPKTHLNKNNSDKMVEYKNFIQIWNTVSTIQYKFYTLTIINQNVEELCLFFLLKSLIEKIKLYFLIS